MCQTRGRREATYYLFKYLALHYFYKRMHKIAVIGSETWTWDIQVEAFKKNLCCCFPCCCLDKNLSENSSESPLGDLG